MTENLESKLLDLAREKFGKLNFAEEKLFTLAQEKFSELTLAEFELFRRIANGQPAEYGTQPDQDRDTNNANSWGDDRTLRADRIRWLCIKPEVWELCLPQEVDISGAKIKESLNLCFTKVDIPLRFSQCYFAQALLLQQAKLRRLDLTGTRIASIAIPIIPSTPFTPTSIDAREISVIGSVLLSNEFQAEGTVSLYGATIGGNLDCEKGTFTNENENGYALLAQGVNVTGYVFLRNEFQARGTVSLYGATIGGNLDCSKGTFTNENENGYALLAQGLNVKGSVFLNDEFQAKGTVNLYGATIGGNLSCRKGMFTNENGYALLAPNINVKGSVFLSDEFQAKGTVRLYGATIGGNLECDKGTFINENGDALNAERVNVTGYVFLRDGFQAKGTVNLYGATIGGNLSCRKGMFTNENGDALLAQGVNVKGSVFLDGGFQAKGRLSLYNARIDQTLIISRIRKPEGMSLRLEFAKVQTLDYAADSLPSPGKLELNGLVYEALGKKSPQKLEQHLNWLRLQPKESFSFQPYEQLAKVLRATGNTDQSTSVLIGKEQDQLRYGNLNWLSKVWKQVLGATIAYGYRPQQAFLFAIGVVAFGFFIFDWGYKTGLITPTDKNCTPSNSQQEQKVSQQKQKDYLNCPYYPKFDPLIYSLDIFLPIIDLRLKSYWLPNANKGEDKLFHIKSGEWLRYYLSLHIISGWVLTTLWVAGFSGIVRSNNK
jgi:cytoskeletal protein CcmA (bactofilin family)